MSRTKKNSADSKAIGKLKQQPITLLSDTVVIQGDNFRAYGLKPSDENIQFTVDTHLAQRGKWSIEIELIRLQSFTLVPVFLRSRLGGKKLKGTETGELIECMLASVGADVMEAVVRVIAYLCDQEVDEVKIAELRRASSPVH